MIPVKELYKAPLPSRSSAFHSILYLRCYSVDGHLYFFNKKLNHTSQTTTGYKFSGAESILFLKRVDFFGCTYIGSTITPLSQNELLSPNTESQH